MAFANPPVPAPTPVVGAAGTSFRYCFANADYDESQAVLRVDSQAVAVEPKPLQLLAELLRHVNEVVTRDELHELIWERRVPIDNVLPNAVNKLRKALGEAAAAHIVSLPRVGYRLLGPVERTVVGRLGAQALVLTEGEAVQGRPGFELVRALGAGGRGNVWLARHAKLDVQRVFKFAADADGLRSLKREFSLYRLLKAELGERADYAHVLDANFSESPYHLECEAGGPDLLAWAEAGHLQAMAREQRVELMVQIAQAVAAAHSVGVLHKDLKPANVLMGGGPGAWQPQLTDFGSGHAIDPERLRQLGLTAMGLTVTQGVSADTTLGTAMYLAPEVQAGQASTAQSDLYALGLMLYQLLAGNLRKTMSTGWQRDVDDELLCEDIAAATEGQPKDRLGSVAEWVDRLSKLEVRRIERLSRRDEARRAATALADQQRRRGRRPWMIGAVVSLLAGLAASIVFGLQTRRALENAQELSARAEAINDFLTKDVIQSSDLSRVGSNKLPTIVDVLDRARDRAAERFSSQPLTEASVRIHLGQTYLHIMMASSAETQFRRAASLLEPLTANDDPNLLLSRFGLAQALAQRYRAKEAKVVLESAETVGRAQLIGATSELAFTALRARVDVMVQLQELKEALPISKRFVKAADTWPGTSPIRRHESRLRMAEILTALGDVAGARTVLTEVTGAPFGSHTVGVVLFERARLGLARNLVAENRRDEAKQLLLEVIANLTEVLGPTAMHVGLAHYEMGNIVSVEGDHRAARRHLQAALLAFSTSLGNEHGFTMSIRSNMTVQLVIQGDASRGLREIDTLLPWYQARGAEEDALKFYRGWALNDLGRPAEALAALKDVNPERLAWLHWGEAALDQKLQAERGRAIAALGQRTEGLEMIRSALTRMVELKADPTVIEHYRKIANAKDLRLR